MLCHPWACQDGHFSSCPYQGDSLFSHPFPLPSPIYHPSISASSCCLHVVCNLHSFITIFQLFPSFIVSNHRKPIMEKHPLLHTQRLADAQACTHKHKRWLYVWFDTICPPRVSLLSWPFSISFHPLKCKVIKWLKPPISLDAVPLTMSFTWQEFKLSQERFDKECNCDKSTPGSSEVQIVFHLRGSQNLPVVLDLTAPKHLGHYNELYHWPSLILKHPIKAEMF